MSYCTKLDQPEILRLLFPETDSKGELQTFAGDAGAGLASIHDELLASGNQFACQFYLADSDDAPIAVFFADPGENLAAVTSRVNAYRESGLHVVAVRYRLSGESHRDAIKTMLDDAAQLLATFLPRMPGQWFSSPVFLIGNGLGNLCAVELAITHRENLQGVILESCIGRTVPYLQALGVDTAALNLVEEDGFQMTAKIAMVKIPTLLLHGSKDPLVSVTEVETIHAHCGAKNKQFFVIPGATRGDIPQAAGKLYFETIKKHVDKLSGRTRYGYKKKRRAASTQGEGDEA
jgi:pimeloyl-ACP methyl ester carboxylesterase